jgi:co-chaperonin GroES (HSP10)
MQACEAVAAKVRPRPGAVVAAFGTRAESTTGGILLTEDSRFRTDPPSLAVCLAAGEGVPLVFGDALVVRRRCGKKVAGFDPGGLGPAPFVTVFYGREGGLCWSDERRMVMRTEKAVTVEWHKTVMGVLEEGRVRATKGNVVVRLSPVKEKEGSLYLPDTLAARDCRCTVVSVGEGCDWLTEGATVIVHEGSTELFTGEDGNEYAVLPAEGVLCSLG